MQADREHGAHHGALSTAVRPGAAPGAPSAPCPPASPGGAWEPTAWNLLAVMAESAHDRMLTPLFRFPIRGEG